MSRLDGWLNTDIDDSSIMYLNAVEVWPVPPGSVSYIYADNFIEHITIDDARRFLSNAFTALRPGGIIRIVTPNVRTAAEAYLGGGSLLEAMLDRHRRNGYRVEYAVDVLRIVFAESEHWRGYLYDEEALSAELRRAGFVDASVCRVGESAHPPLRGLDSRAEPIEDALQLVLESRRPPPAS
jgi:predicted SAM-dependent methyltransferase